MDCLKNKIRNHFINQSNNKGFIIEKSFFVNSKEKITKKKKKKLIHLIRTLLMKSSDLRVAGHIMNSNSLFEGRVKRKGFFNPNSVGRRQAWTAGRSSVFENSGSDVRR